MVEERNERNVVPAHHPKVGLEVLGGPDGKGCLSIVELLHGFRLSGGASLLGISQCRSRAEPVECQSAQTQKRIADFSVGEVRGQNPDSN